MQIYPTIVKDSPHFLQGSWVRLQGKISYFVLKL